MNSSRSTAGFTLFEVLIVVLILGVAANVAIPMLSSGDTEKLDVAAGEIIQALRFARSEALRQSTCTGVLIQPNVSASPNQVTALRWSDCSPANFTSTILTNPVDKKAYDFRIDELPNASGVITSSADFLPVNSAANRIYFFSDGSPRVWQIISVLPPVFQYVPLTSGTITLQYKGKNRTIDINPTGRIR
jgi:prepilin-type N-terminal cleavage/methylation domain-containing protein